MTSDNPATMTRIQSPSALNRYLGCEHRTYLDILERRGELKAGRQAPQMEVLFERGQEFVDG